MKEISVCVVDDNRDLRIALEEIITMSDGFKCIGIMSSAEDAVNQIPILKPEVVLMDINLGTDETGIDVKKTSPSKMLDSIRELYEGGAPMSSQIARKVVVAFQQQAHINTDGTSLDVLSPRENEILEYLSKGLMYKEIASQLILSPETVRKHVYHIYEKLHVTNRVAAVNKFYGR